MRQILGVALVAIVLPACANSASGTAPDALTDAAGRSVDAPTAADGAAAQGSIPCGKAICTATQVCVHHGSTCGVPPPCSPMGDAGACPAGTVSCTNPGGQAGCMPSCRADPQCWDIPTRCNGVPTCACLGAPCPCTDVSGRDVSCASAP
jgi:hypothetical protein